MRRTKEKTIKERRGTPTVDRKSIHFSDNFAFLAGKSTTDLILIKKMILEDAKMYNKPLYLFDLDLQKAFDRVPRYIKEMALRRLNLPENVIHAWSICDNTRALSVKTAYGYTLNL